MSRPPYILSISQYRLMSGSEWITSATSAAIIASFTSLPSI